MYIGILVVLLMLPITLLFFGIETLFSTDELSEMGINLNGS